MFVLTIAMVGLGEYIASTDSREHVREEPKEFILVDNPTHYYDSLTYELKPIER